MRRNEHTADEQREMAVAAAEMLLIQHGMDGVTMRKVAQSIGYAVGQLYKVFKNQDALLLAISERTATSLLECLQQAVASTAQPDQRIHAVSQAYIAFGLRYPHRWRLLFSHRIEQTTELPQSNIHKAQKLFEFLEGLLSDDCPELPPSALRETATSLWAGVHGIAALAVDDKLSWSSYDDPKKICRRMVATFLEGIRAPAKSRRS